MWLQSIYIKNVRGFEEATMELSKTVNVFVGRNNSGKSSLLHPVLSMQQNLATLGQLDVRVGEKAGEVRFRINETDGRPNSKEYLLTVKQDERRQWVTHFTSEGEAAKKDANGKQIGTMRVFTPTSHFQSTEPDNFIYPYLSMRKVPTYEQAVNEATTRQVRPNLSNLVAKIDRVSSPGAKKAYEFYQMACEEILGFLVTTAPAQQGKQIVYSIDGTQTVGIERMGQGVANIAALLADLALAKGKLFIIEELENDIHPRALRMLADRILEKSIDNQFLITTHSNVVLKRLGGLNSTKVFHVIGEYNSDGVPTSKVTEVPGESGARRGVLEDLGYELADLELWSGWLLLEESSAEKIIRQYLCRWFTPRLVGRLRTFAAGSLSQVEEKVRNFNDLFVFLHLEAVYRNKAWVVVDGGPDEATIIADLKKKYVPAGWNEHNFLQWSVHDFEEFYPPQFACEVEKFRTLRKQERRSAKKALLDRLESWIGSDENGARAAFENSAKPVIDLLKGIEAAIA
jgi:predicted ATPase